MPNFGLGDALLDQLKGVGVVVPDDFAALIIIEAYSTLWATLEPPKP